MKTRTLFGLATVLLVSSSLVAAQTSPSGGAPLPTPPATIQPTPTPPTSGTGGTTTGGTVTPPTPTQPAPTPALGNTFPDTLRLAQDAARSLEHALRDAYQFEYLSANTTVTVSLPGGLETTAQQVLAQAQESYVNQAYFEAKQQADAAQKLYKALEQVLSANGVYTPVVGPDAATPFLQVGPGPGGKGKGKKGPKESALLGGSASLDAFYKAQEELYVLGQEMTYYDASSATVSGLLDAAQSLLNQAQTVSTQGDTDASQLSMLVAPNPVALAYADAAKEVAKAARNLISAERGF